MIKRLDYNNFDVPMADVLQEALNYLIGIQWLEAAGLLFGLLAVYYLIKENILTWPTGIAYVLTSFVVFWQQQLYGDFLLHIVFLILNIYGWYYWSTGKKGGEERVAITSLGLRQNFIYLALTALGVFIFGYFLSNVHVWFEHLKPASLPYWDATTTALSVTGMMLTARKRIENWYYWLAVDILASGIYFYKGIYFYALLYFIYIGLAIVGYLEWKKLINKS